MTMAETNGTAGAGHNSNALSDDQQRALGFHHKRLWQTALDAKKAAEAEVKKAEKRAGMDGISKSDLKLMRDLDGKAGDAALRSTLERTLRVAKWMGANVGTQFSFDDLPDRTPITERAFERGKLDGMKGETCRTPEGYSGETEQNYIAGWQAGQAILMSALELTKGGMADQPQRRGRPKKGEATPPPVDERQVDVEDVAAAEQAPAFAG